MTNLILDSLEIQGFRAFKHLTIEKLGRVNLIVGKNSIGKSSVLEALRIYATRGSVTLLNRILQERDEGEIDDRGRNINALNSIHYLFCGRDDKIDNLLISIGQLREDNQRVSINLRKTLQSSIFELDNQELSNEMGNDALDLVIQHGSKKHSFYSNLNITSDAVLRQLDSDITPINMYFIPSGGLARLNLARIWDSIALTDLEPLVISSLQIIAPEIERLNFLAERKLHPIAFVRMKGVSTRIPLRSFGEGMSRILGIALSLVAAKDGLLLIDEIESGLHYSVQPDMWKLIFETARRLNIQVVATTHSWDCIQGFQQAAQEDQQSEGMLIRLGRKQEEIVATLYSEQDLEIVTREQIEVR